jgi:glycerate dehydrogenase
MELAGKALGIIGFGRIGRAVGKIANAFGMNVIAYNRSQCDEGKAIGSYVNLEELLSTSDVISLHCPLTAENTGMINAQTIAKMKNGAILINTARGPLVDEAALAAALESGKLRAAACDVISAEPMAENNPLKTAPNCIVTPHMAWAPIESRKRIQECTDRSIQAFLAGSPINTVNM